MSGDRDSYHRAVQQFLLLTEAPLRDAFLTPRALSVACGIPPSSGYRAIATLEANGWLRRSSAGAYMRGNHAIRAGLAAWGIGQVAPVAHPVVEQLRRESSRTGFLAAFQEDRLSIGPFSAGRGSDYLIPERQDCRILSREIRKDGQVLITILMDSTLVFSLAAPLRVEPVEHVVGVFGRAVGDLDDPQLSGLLSRAVNRLQGSEE